MIKQILNERGELHSFNDEPAYIEYDDETGAVLAEKWYQNGELHRDGDQPAVLIYDRENSEIIRTEAYYYFGLLHREGDEPAEILRDSEGNLEQVQYYNMGFLHRAVGPASIRYCPDDGRVWGSEFWIEDECSERLVESYPHGPLVKENSGSPRREVSLGEVSAEVAKKARAFAEFKSNVFEKLNTLSTDERMAIRIVLGTAFRKFFKNHGLSEDGIQAYFSDATGNTESLNHEDCIQRYALGNPDGADNLLARMIFLYFHDEKLGYRFKFAYS